ncbi:T9SS type A sorting domain-containing protein [Larkinella insperata]|uniref:T9SS type A sorting domain-containing protein n=1 Tax=Larkinella insperata TaxID=332158 RepID=A0ABW3Q8G4_9BACT|nr:T9SS type A sorting domain-containing protein [Larkinella insperata]
MVFQRNKGNEASLWIGGYYALPFSRIQVRAEPMDGGTLLDWTTLQDNPKGGAFAGSVTVRGGWYRLRIRGLQGEQYIEGGGVERIGVGEVFVVAGQSNGQGFFNFGEQGASSDRVSCVDVGIGDESPRDPNTLEFSHLDAGKWIFPRGQSAWCWGALGDRLVARLGVPVLFFNAAWQGSSSKNWRESSEGLQTASDYDGAVKFQVGQPYGNLRTALNYYVQTLGIRAILWHQGEADNFSNRSVDDYFRNLSGVITKSRDHSGRDISWVVSRASYDDERGVDGNIIAGQNRVIQTVRNVFAGPETDGIQIPRVSSYDPDRVHFHDYGLIQLADAWSNSLNDGFFQNSTPQDPRPGATLSVSCAGNNTLSLRVDGNYTSFNWGPNGNAQTINVGTGRYMATVKDALGNTVFTAPYQVPDRPTITATGPTTFCEGGSVTLASNYDNTFWSNNATGRNVAVSAAGTYRAVYRDVGNCEFTSNNEIAVNVNPLPATPTVRNLGQARFCDRNATTLEATDALTYNWSTGEKTKQVEVRRGGTYSLTVTDQNGCISRQSNQVAIIVDPLPNRPTISVGGPTTFCADQNVTLTSTAEANYVWESGQTARSITINQPGNYMVRTRNIYNCLSDPSNTVSIQVNALPAPPTVTASGSTTFCDGERVTLTASGSLKAFWNVGDSTQSIVATRSNTYAARVRDANGCFSPTSASIVVDVKPVPSVPTVQQIGTYTLEAAGTRQGDYYLWERDNVAVEPRTSIIKADQTGAYRTRAYLAYEGNLVCASDFSAPIAFTLIIDNEGLSIYPNPSPDKELTLETLENITDATLTLMTLSGQVIWKTTVEDFNRQRTWNLSTVPAGHYILNVRSATFNVSKRLLIGL